MVVTVILTYSHCSHCPVLKIKTLSSVLLQIPHRERKTRPRREFRRQPGLCSRPPKRVIKWDEKQQHKVVFFLQEHSVLKIKIHTKKRVNAIQKESIQWQWKRDKTFKSWCSRRGLNIYNHCCDEWEKKKEKYKTKELSTGSSSEKLLSGQTESIYCILNVCLLLPIKRQRSAGALLGAGVLLLKVPYYTEIISIHF